MAQSYTTERDIEIIIRRWERAKIPKMSPFFLKISNKAAYLEKVIEDSRRDCKLEFVRKKLDDPIESQIEYYVRSLKHVLSEETYVRLLFYFQLLREQRILRKYTKQRPIRCKVIQTAAVCAKHINALRTSQELPKKLLRNEPAAVVEEEENHCHNDIPAKPPCDDESTNRNTLAFNRNPPPVADIKEEPLEEIDVRLEAYKSVPLYDEPILSDHRFVKMESEEEEPQTVAESATKTEADTKVEADTEAEAVTGANANQASCDTQPVIEPSKPDCVKSNTSAILSAYYALRTLKSTPSATVLAQKAVPVGQFRGKQFRGCTIRPIGKMKRNSSPSGSNLSAGGTIDLSTVSQQGGTQQKPRMLHLHPSLKKQIISNRFFILKSSPPNDNTPKVPMVAADKVDQLGKFVRFTKLNVGATLKKCGMPTLAKSASDSGEPAKPAPAKIKKYISRSDRMHDHTYARQRDDSPVAANN